MKNLDKARELLTQYRALKEEIVKELSAYSKQDIFLDDLGYVVVKDKEGMLTTSLEPAFTSIEKYGVIKANEELSDAEDAGEEYFGDMEKK